MMAQVSVALQQGSTIRFLDPPQPSGSVGHYLSLMCVYDSECYRVVQLSAHLINHHDSSPPLPTLTFLPLVHSIRIRPTALTADPGLARSQDRRLTHEPLPQCP
jgi:hypothetical protein